MLILHRNADQSILIGSNIKITILAHSSAKGVKIGIEAPDDIRILREELVTKEKENVDQKKV